MGREGFLFVLMSEGQPFSILKEVFKGKKVKNVLQQPMACATGLSQLPSLCFIETRW